MEKLTDSSTREFATPWTNPFAKQESEEPSMDEMDYGDESNPLDFDGVVPVFPLPNLVMFPSLVQPLHVFEPRYRQMAIDALAGNRMIALALLKPGYEANYDTKECEIHPIVCVGRITNEEHLGDGRYNFLLRGISRAVVSEEVESDKLYRMAKVELQSSVETNMATEDLAVAKRELIQEIERLIPSLSKEPAFPEVFSQKIELGALCDLVTFSSGVSPELAQAVLEELDIGKRFELVRRILKLKVYPDDASSSFPPDFSVN